MKSQSLRFLFVSALALAVAAPTSLAQRQLGGKAKGPVSKLYVAETEGETDVQNGDKIFSIRQSSAFDAPGTIIETKADSHNTLVYSNGTGLFVDEMTRLEIKRFSQEPFKAEPASQFTSAHEPSISQSDVLLSHGLVALCTSQLISGSAMLYHTPHASINIRGGRLVIESTATETIVDLLEGDLTIRQGTRDVSGQILRPGERAIIRPAAGAGQEPTITIEPIPAKVQPRIEERTAKACNARRSVTFESVAGNANDGNEIAGAGAGDIVARPTVPQEPPTNIVVSPDRLPGT
ncbi:MAG TPA: hypothetical protein VG734_22620 [Lacunisphaera sp.]|nr:hypothetical protein [Lacunisphaera sp.]